MTYDEQLAARQAADQERAKASRALLAKIAKALGGKFELDKSEHNGTHDGRVWGDIVLDGIAVHVTADGWNNAGRLSFSIAWPEYKNSEGHTQTMQGRDCLNSDERAALNWDITVSKDKEPERIAKDVTRRLIDPMRPVYAKALERIKSTIEYQDGQAARVAYFLKTFPHYAERKRNNGQARFYGTGCMPTVELSSESIRFESFYADYETAYKILAILKSAKQE